MVTERWRNEETDGKFSHKDLPHRIGGLIGRRLGIVAGFGTHALGYGENHSK